MSTHQQSKPRAAKKSMTEESARPGTCRSKVGCDAIDEPCTNRMVPAGPAGSPAYFSNRNRRTSPFWVQCSSPRIAAIGATGLFMLALPTSMLTRPPLWLTASGSRNPCRGGKRLATLATTDWEGRNEIQHHHRRGAARGCRQRGGDQGSVHAGDRAGLPGARSAVREGERA